MSTPHDKFKVGGLNKNSLGLSSKKLSFSGKNTQVKKIRAKSPLDVQDFTNLARGNNI